MTSMGTRAVKLSHKAFRALLKKFKRKKKRQQLAIARDEIEELEQRKRECSPNYEEREAERKRNANLWEEFQAKESARKNREWLQREEQAQIEFRRKKILQEQEKERKEEERKKMLLEIESQNMLVNTSAKKVEELKNKKEEALQEALSGLPKADESWHNPFAPVHNNNTTNTNHVISEKDQCSFFAKTGCCRFGDRCSRGHLHPAVSTTILMRGLYTHFSIGQSHRDDYDTDMALEFDDRDTYKDFEQFYEDVLPEFRKCGRVTQFKVCSNHELHLRGNVYVQFSREEYAVEAFQKFNGRFYAGKQISCEFTAVTNWKSAICGLFKGKTCPKGDNCNFLHVFQNPDGEFWAADRNVPEDVVRLYRDRRRRVQNDELSLNSYSERSYYRHRSRSPSSHSSRSYTRSERRSSRRRRDSSESADTGNSSRDYSYTSRRWNEESTYRERSFKRRQRSKSKSTSPRKNGKSHNKQNKKSKKKKKRKSQNSSSSNSD